METESRAEKYRKICSRATLQDQKEGFFFSLAETLAENIDLNTYSKFTTDFDRAKYVTLSCWSSIGAELIYRGKKVEEAIAKRKAGDGYLSQKEYQKAMLLYSQSIIQAPVGEELMKAYTQRSKVLQAMGDYELAIADCELAVTYNAPEESR